VKEGLRKQFLLKRKEISQERRLEANAQVLEKLIEISRQYNHILSYSPLEWEVCVSSFNKALAKSGRLSLPRIEGSSLVPYRVNDMENQLKTFSHKFLEPDNSCQISDKIDLVIVPGIVFDKNGGRIGFGKGFYDKFLEMSKIPSIGICFKEQILDGDLPIETHDIAMESLCIV
jgi:5-formyltetrahydrofolate cyclo-ligase